MQYIIPVSAMLLFWALTPVSIAFIKDDFSLFFQIWLRYLSSATALWLFLFTRKSVTKDLKTLFKKPVYYCTRLSVTAVCTILFQLMYTRCFFLIPPGFGILLYQSQVLFSVLLGLVFFQSERMLMKKPAAGAGLIMALSGAALVIIFQGHGFSIALNTGILLALGGALSWSFVGITVRKWIGDSLSPLFTVTLVFTLVTAFFSPFLLFTGSLITGSPGVLQWVVLVGSGLLGIAGGQGLYYYLLPHLGIITASSVQLLVPFLTGLFSFLIFGEHITGLQLTGGVILLTGCRIILVQKQKIMNISHNNAPANNRIKP